tara:strand:+ start:2948 stop:3421 length:474 start_codon:yes stop_codon:yes gene_type:complete
MPTVVIGFHHVLNGSVQVGDIAYYINPIDVGASQNWQTTTTPHATGSQRNIIKIGKITDLDCCNPYVGGPPAQCTGSGCPTGGHIVCDMDQDLYNLYSGNLTDGSGELDPSFIMFSKDNKANMSSILGYYASVQFKNDSTEEAELFNVGTDFFESSK